MLLGVKYMLKSIIIVLILTMSCNTASNRNSNEIKLLINHFVSANCVNTAKCSIKLNEFTKFNWDKLYFFDMAVETATIAKVINHDFSDSSDYYSRKLIFMKGKKVVHIEKYLILEVDEPIKDEDIDFEVKDSQNKYAVYNSNSTFKIDIIKTDTGEFYRLSCIDCK